MLSTSDLDAILTLQLAVAYAGEKASEPHSPAARLGWWNTDMYDADGGVDFFERLTPRTKAWAPIQAARIAAVSVDARKRTGTLAKPDHAISLFHLGYEIDEALNARLAHHKRTGTPPTKALPALAELLDDDPAAFKVSAFVEWLEGGGNQSPTTLVPAGRLMQGDIPRSALRRAQALACALLPLPETGDYPLPHYMVETTAG